MSRSKTIDGGRATPPGRRALRCALVSSTVLLSLAPARADDATKAQCATAYERAQEHRAAGRLRKARQALLICAQQECPAFVQSDCLEWLPEVERELPSVVIVARGLDGADTGAVRVTIDDELVADHLDGTAIDVDPGYHQFRFEHAGAPPVERRLLIRQTQKNRAIEVSFQQTPESPGLRTEPSVTLPPAPKPEPGPLRPWAFVAGGVGGAGLVGFAVIGLIGRNEHDHLEETCKGHCAEGEVDAVRLKYLLADVSLGVGVAGLATGAVLYVLSQPKGTERTARRRGLEVEVAPLAGGANLGVTGFF